MQTFRRTLYTLKDLSCRVSDVPSVINNWLQDGDLLILSPFMKPLRRRYYRFEPFAGSPKYDFIYDLETVITHENYTTIKLGNTPIVANVTYRDVECI